MPAGHTDNSTRLHLLADATSALGDYGRIAHADGQREVARVMNTPIEGWSLMSWRGNWINPGMMNPEAHGRAHAPDATGAPTYDSVCSTSRRRTS